jgi:hypothetical protein
MLAKKNDAERWLFIPDTHAPYHDKKALSLIQDTVMADVEFDGICILGDFYDCYAVSDYRKDPRRERSLRRELLLARAARKPFDDYGFKRRVFIKGNHEWRLERYLETHAPELYEEVMSQDLLGLEGWEVIEYMEDTQVGKINVTHDIGYAGLTSTRKTMIDYMDNVVMGHNHMMQFFVEGNAKGITHVGASFGWLGDVKKVDYKHQMKARKEWVLGFGVGTLKKSNGHMYLKPCPILHDYTCEVDGTIYSYQGGL